MSENTTTAVTIPGGNNGLQLTNIDEMWKFAGFILRSKLAPKGMESQEAIVVALQMGAEIGLPPMGSIQNIAVINGRPSIWGDAAKAVVMGTGLCERFEEWFEGKPFEPDFKAVCEVQRKGYTRPTRQEFSVADAKMANLWGKAGPWQQFPKRMLQMRARGFAARDAFPDALRGLLLAEEARDVAPRVSIDAEVENVVQGSPATPVTTKADQVKDKLGRKKRQIEAVTEAAPVVEQETIAPEVTYHEDTEPEPAPEPEGEVVDNDGVVMPSDKPTLFAEIREAISTLATKGIRSTEIEAMAAEVSFDPNWKAWGNISDLQLFLTSLRDRMEDLS
jgi:hypothetical protein